MTQKNKAFDPKRPNAHLPPTQQVSNLLAANAAAGIKPAAPIDGLPRAWRAQGYEQLAVLMTQRGTPLSASALRNYWKTDRERGYSSLMPPPDAIIQRGQETEDVWPELLPGWAPETILEWMPYRQGPGNHTRGETREGNTNGRTGGKFIDGEWVKTGALVAAGSVTA